MPSWYIRVDCIEDDRIGTGHLRRCIAFASFLENKGDSVHFLVNDNAFGIELLSEDEFDYSICDSADTKQLEFKDFVFIDLYDGYKQSAYLDNLRAMAKKSVVITDSYDKEDLEVDFVIATNQALAPVYNNAEKYLVGPSFFIMSDEFADLQRLRTAPVSNILVAFGGYDPFNVTLMVVKALISIREQLSGIGVSILIGPMYPFRADLESIIIKYGVDFNLCSNIQNIAVFYSEHDYAITAAGNTFYEALTLGIPCSVIAQNQRQAQACKANEGLFDFDYLGFYDDLDIEGIEKRIVSFVKNNDNIKKYSSSCIRYFDRDGKERVYNKLIS